MAYLMQLRRGLAPSGPASRLSHPAPSAAAPFPSARAREESNERQLSPLGLKTLSSDLTRFAGPALDLVTGCLQPHSSGWSSSSHHGGLHLDIHSYTGQELGRDNLGGSLGWWGCFIYSIPCPQTVRNFLPWPLPSAMGERKGGLLLPEGTLTTFMPPPKGPQ